METVWTMLVPIMVIMVGRKAFKALGLGDLMNPLSALALATGGAGKMMGDGGATLAMGRGLAAGAASVATSPLRAGQWAASDKRSARVTRAVAGAGFAGAKATAKAAWGMTFADDRKERRAALAERTRLAAARADLTLGRVGAALAGSGAGEGTGSRFGGITGALGGAWKSADNQILSAGGTLLGAMAAAGARLTGEGYPDLARALDTWSKQLHPGNPARIQRRYDRELGARLAGVTDDEEAARITAQVARARQVEMAGSILGGKFNVDGALTPKSLSALVSSYADFHKVPREHVLADARTGWTALRPAGENRIPPTDDPAVLEAYARSPLTWLPPEVTDRRDGESEGEYAFRMRATCDRLGLIDPGSGATVDMLEYFGLELSPDLLDDLQALSAGKKTSLRDLIGTQGLTPSDQALRDIDVNVKYNYADPDSPKQQQAIVAELQNSVARVQLEVADVNVARVSAHEALGSLAWGVGRAESPVQQQLAVDKLEDRITDAFTDLFGQLGDKLVTVSSALAVSEATPTEMVAMVPALDKFQDRITDDLSKVMDQLAERLHAVRSAEDPGAANRLARDLDGWFESTADRLSHDLETGLGAAARALADQADRAARLSGAAHHGVARPGNYANGSEPPGLHLVG